MESAATSEQAKNVEKKVRELIVRKLFTKVDEEHLFRSQEEVDLLVDDIVLLAKCDSNIAEAMGFDLDDESRRIDLETVVSEYSSEIAAYSFYLSALEVETGEEDIYDGVFLALNSDSRLLEKRLNQLIMVSLSARVLEQDAEALGVDRWALIANFANQVKLIAGSESMEEAVEAAYSEYSDHPELQFIPKADILSEFERFAPLAAKEINAYRLAIDINKQTADMNMVLAMVQQMLRVGLD